MDREEMNKKMGKVIAKALSDAEFKARLLANPEDTLQAEGIEVPAGVKVNAVENTDEQFYLVIPKAPGELSDDQLSNVAGGRTRAIKSGDPPDHLRTPPGHWDWVDGKGWTFIPD